MNLSTVEIWTVIAGLAIGTFLIRFSFLGIVGNRPLPAWLLRLLRYTPVAVLPGLVAPLVLWPAATGGVPEAARLLAALATLGIGLAVRNTLFAIIGGAATLYTMLWLLG
jgi:branched-subunit amino acid transport protein